MTQHKNRHLIVQDLKFFRILLCFLFRCKRLDLRLLVLEKFFELFPLFFE